MTKCVMFMCHESPVALECDNYCFTGPGHWYWILIARRAPEMCRVLRKASLGPWFVTAGGHCLSGGWCGDGEWQSISSTQQLHLQLCRLSLLTTPPSHSRYVLISVMLWCIKLVKKMKWFFEKFKSYSSYTSCIKDIYVGSLHVRTYIAAIALSA